MEKFISSRENKIIKQLISLQKKSSRTKLSLFTAEGKRICDEAVVWAKNRICYFAVAQSFYEKHGKISPDFDTYILTDDLFAKVSNTETPQGIMCVLKCSESTSYSPVSPNILILDGVSEPGNMGTILRTAEAMGFSDIFITKGSADIYNPKGIRSTMGAVFRLNFYFEENNDFIDNLINQEYKIISTALKNSISLEETPVFPKNAVVIGNEATGVSDEILSKSDIITKIDMAGNAESLNAAVAAGIVMYKFSQRSK